jgi:hypothetical protein
MKVILRRLHWFLRTQLGIDPQTLWRSLRGLPRYMRDFCRFRACYAGRLELIPCLHDWYEEGGATKSEYFWQDLLVARMIFDAKPHRHVDVGSRVDGFVAHVASFREIEVFDVRPITARIPGVIFKQADFMRPQNGMTDYCDSLSCLHALEHFGLGRYGDPVDPDGFSKGLANMSVLVKGGGVFYLSVPIGTERVEFNANRVFDPCRIIDLAKKSSLELSALSLIREGRVIDVLDLDQKSLYALNKDRYALGIFTFKKTEFPIQN